VEANGNDGSSLSVLESVRCLECGLVYAKPIGGGTAAQNPGCPECGYVGWLAVNIPFSERDEQRRSAGDPLPGRSAPPR
jgi:predicted  nucleic acid-binding Zn-ribbon protein